MIKNISDYFNFDLRFIIIIIKDFIIIIIINLIDFYSHDFKSDLFLFTIRLIDFTDLIVVTVVVLIVIIESYI